VSCSATDGSGNTGHFNFTVKVVDTTAPVLTLPNDITKEATGPTGATVTFAATATDLGESISVTCIPASGSVFALGVKKVDCEANDGRGNNASGSFNVTVQDTTPPDLNMPADITKEATGPNGAIVTFSATATDLVDPNPVVNCNHASGSTFAVGETTVSCTAKDASNNTSAAKTFKVNIVDTTPPDLSVPGDISKEATGPNGAIVTFSATATDLVDPNPVVNCNHASGSTFAVGETTVSCTAKDASNNTSAAKTFKVTVVDTTPPTLTLPANITREATGPAGAAVNFTAAAMDLVDGAVMVHCTPASGSTFALGTAAVNCSATDAHSNTASGSFSVTVVDTTPPALTLPGNIAQIAMSAQGNIVSFSASAYDLVSGNVAVNCTPGSGAMFAPGTTTVNCSATDAHLNTATGSFTVTVTFSWSGFLQPINIDNSSVFKQGSTVPVKFQLTGASAGIPNVVAKILVAKVSNGIIGNFIEDVISTSAATTGNLFRYDASGNLYIFNWSTKGYTSGTYVIKVDMLDGVNDRIVYVGLR
jgi:hypothetical protein